MNKDTNECKNTQSYTEDEGQNRQQKETRQYVYKIIIEVLFAALERPVGKNNTQLGSLNRF